MFADTAVTVTGCLTGANRSHNPVDDVTRPTDIMLTVAIASADQSGQVVACTDTIVDNGYETTISQRQPLRETVTVAHDNTDGRHSVTSSTA